VDSAPAFDATGDPVYRAATPLTAGLAEMHLGRWEQAQARTRESLALCRETGVAASEGECLLTLACLALVAARQLAGREVTGPGESDSRARDEWLEARSLAQESLSSFREMRHRSGRIHALALMGAAEVGLGDLVQAGGHIEQALASAHETGSFQPSLLALAAEARLLAAEGRPERATVAYALAARHPLVGSSRWFDIVFGRPISWAAATLPPEIISAAKEHGRARDLQDAVRELAEKRGHGRAVAQPIGQPQGRSAA
jgi:hypothetical protein